MSDEQTFRNFDEEYPVVEIESVTFQMGGYVFHTRKNLPPGLFLMKERGTRGAVETLRATLIKSDVDKLNELLDDPDSKLSVIMLDAAAGWVLRHLSGAISLPPTSPDTSGNLPDSDGSTSGDASPSLEVVSPA